MAPCSLQAWLLCGYLGAEEGLRQAVSVHHVYQVVQHAVEDTVQLLSVQRHSLDQGQLASVQFRLGEGERQGERVLKNERIQKLKLI